MEEYAGGEIKAYHGIVNKWLLVVYAVLAVFGVYYLVKYWGGPDRLGVFGDEERGNQEPVGLCSR